MDTTEKGKLIEEYREKRNLTVKKMLEIAGLSFAESKAVTILDNLIRDVTADSRKLTDSSVLFYWGETHPEKYTFDIFETARNKTCLLVITDKKIPMDENVCQIILDPDEADVKEAYISVIRYIRDIHSTKIISVTGSVGKTSTKEMIESVLRSRYKKPVISKGNNNSFFAVARNIQSLNRQTAVYLQEVGAAKIGTVEFSAKQLGVNMAVYTNIGESHIEDYGSVENIVKDKLSLSEYGKDGCVDFINYDDKALMGYRFPKSHEVVTYSFNDPKADFFASDVKNTDDGYEFTINKREKALLGHKRTKISAKVNVSGRHNILNAVVAFAVGTYLNITEEKILLGLNDYKPSGMRQNILNFEGYNVFADCYNSSLIAVDNALSAMDDINVSGKKIAVLGDVLRLGDRTEDTHREIGKSVMDHDVDEVIFYGNNIKYAYEECLNAIENGETSLKAYYFTERSEMERQIMANLDEDDIIMFKASHAVNLGASIDRLFKTDMNESQLMGSKTYRKEIKDDFEYYIFEDHATVRRYLGHDEIVEIPETVDAEIEIPVFDIKEVRTIPVDKLGKTSFKGMDHVKTVIAKENIFVREGAFDGTSITLKSKED